MAISKQNSSRFGRGGEARFASVDCRKILLSLCLVAANVGAAPILQVGGDGQLLGATGHACLFRLDPLYCFRHRKRILGDDSA